MNKYKKLFGDTVLFSISSFGSKVLTLFLTPLYTAILSTEEYGISDIISTTINFLYPILTLAIADAVLRFALDKQKSKNGVLNTALLCIIASTLLLLCAVPFIGKIDNQLATYWGYFVITYFLFNIHGCFTRFIKGLGLTKLFAIQGLVNTCTIIGSNILFLIVFRWGLNGYLLSTIIGYSSSIIIMIICAKLYRYIFPFEINKTLFKEMLLYSVPMIPTLLAWTMNNAIDKYMIIYFHGLSANGIYSVAHKIPTILTTFTAFFSEAWQLSAINEYGNAEYDQFFTKVYRSFNLILICGVTVFIPFSKFVSSVLFAESYFTAWSAVPFLLTSSAFSALSGFLAAAFRATKNTKGLMKSVLLGAGFNTVLNLILIPIIGIRGAAIATAVSFFVVWFIRFRDAKKIVCIAVQPYLNIASYAIVFLIAGLYTFEIPFFFIVYPIAVVALAVINRKDIMGLIHLLYHTAKSKMHREKNDTK